MFAAGIWARFKYDRVQVGAPGYLGRHRQPRHSAADDDDVGCPRQAIRRPIGRVRYWAHSELF